MSLRQTSILWLIAIGIRVFPAGLKPLSASEIDEGVRLAKQYLQTSSSQKKIALAKKLAPYDGQWRAVLGTLRAGSWSPIKPGYYGALHFSVPKLRKTHPDDLLYFIVPRNYRPERASGLVIFMHGGGKGSPRTSPARYLRTHKPTKAFIGDIFEKTGMIGAAPSAPWNDHDHSRWTIPEADAYLADVISECKRRFHIDPDRVILWGHSMGGFGTFHQVQRQPDRFAAVIAGAGSWTLAQWPVIRGTAFCIVHGTRDAERGIRSRHTDIAFARQADRLLTELRIPHVYKEHPGAHPVAYSKDAVLSFLRSNQLRKRDPFWPHIVLVSPVGYRPDKCFPLRHNRWLTLNASVPNGLLEYDSLRGNGRGTNKDDPPETWKQWRLTYRRLKRPGALIDAINRGGNYFEITTRNVSRFTIWLHPKMIDIGKPVSIRLNVRTRITRRVAPRLVTLLDSFLRRGDWGLVYPARLTVNVPQPTISR